MLAEPKTVDAAHHDDVFSRGRRTFTCPVWTATSWRATFVGSRGDVKWSSLRENRRDPELAREAGFDYQIAKAAGLERLMELFVTVEA